MQRSECEDRPTTPTAEKQWVKDGRRGKAWKRIGDTETREGRTAGEGRIRGTKRKRIEARLTSIQAHEQKTEKE